MAQKYRPKRGAPVSGLVTILKWPEFKARYAKELEGRKAELVTLGRKARAGTITPVFGACDEEHNQAVPLREFKDKRYLKRK